jgi:hypothetical protein
VVGGKHEPLGYGDGNGNLKRRRRCCLGVTAEMERKGLGKRRSFGVPFIPLAGGLRVARGRTRKDALTIQTDAWVIQI